MTSAELKIIKKTLNESIAHHRDKMNSAQSPVTRAYHKGMLEAYIDAVDQVERFER